MLHAHKMPSVAGKIKKADRNHCRKEAELIFPLESIPLFKAWEAKWLVGEERALRCIKKGLFNYIKSYDFDKDPLNSIRTTNILGRTFWEMRRRTRSMNNFFTNEATANRIIPRLHRDAQ